MTALIDDNKKAFKAGSWYLVCNILLKSISFLTAPIFNRLLSTTEVGEYSNLISWASMLVIVLTLSLDSSINNARIDYDRKELDKYISSILIFGSIVTGFFIVIYAFFQEFFSSVLLIKSRYVFLMLGYLLVCPAISIILSVSQVFFEYKKTILITVIQTVANIGLSLILVLCLSNRLDGRVIGTYIPGIVLGLLLYVYFIIKGRSFNFKYIKYALAISLPLVVHLLSGSILSSSDRIIITRLCGEEANALYSVGYTFGSLTSIIWISVNSAFAPWCFNCFNSNEHKKVVKPAFLFFIIFGILLLFVALLAPEGMYILGGASYVVAAPVIAPVLCGIYANALYTFYVNIEQFYKKQIFIAIGTVVSGGINIALNFLFIPKYGYIAAAYTTLISFFLLYAFHFFITRVVLKKKVYHDLIFFATLIVFFILIFITLLLIDYFWIRIAILIALLAGVVAVIIVNRKKLLSYIKRKD